MMGDVESVLRIVGVEDAIQFGLKEEEFLQIVESLGRPLNFVELGIFSALYSEHCSYKSTKVHLRSLLTEGQRVIQGPGENAGVVDIDDGQGVVFKVESHNHPTFIEPFQGAATGVGGIMRDVFTMNARPLALMNSLRFGSLGYEKTRYLLSRAVAGIGNYGNCVGIPTVGGELFFHSSYNGNCLVNAFCLGLVDNDKIFLGHASGVDNAVFYVGSKTGRDGIHGATMASEEFDDASANKRPTVQVGDPFQEKLLIEACLEAMATGVVVGIQDMGAAGLTSSSYEMASRAGTGLRLYLDRIPQRETEMTPYELMLSESQERMLLIIEQGKEDRVLKIFDKWGLDAVRVGEVIAGNEVELYWHGQMISSLPHDVLVKSAPQYRWPEVQPAEYKSRIEFPFLDIAPAKDLGGFWLKMLGSPNLCSRFPVYSQYDSTVRTNTVIHPGGDAAVIRIKNRNGIEKGVAMTLDCNSRYCAIDPRFGAAHSVVEAMRNITSVGAEPIGISDCLNFGSPEKPEGMWQIAEAIRGINDSTRAMQIPIVSGNVSLYNETKGQGILPTPTIAMVGLIRDVGKVVGAQFQDEGDCIFLLGETFEEFGGSEYLAQLADVEKGALPTLDYSLELERANLIRKLIDLRLLQSCHDLSSGGLAIALAECCLSPYRQIGAKIEAVLPSKSIGGDPSERLDTTLFSETGGRYLVSCRARDAAKVIKVLEEFDCPLSMRGVVGGDMIAVDNLAKIDLEQASAVWRTGLSSIFAN